MDYAGSEKNPRHMVLYVFMACCLCLSVVDNIAAARLTPPEVQQTVQETLKCVWAGRPFSSDLAQRQQVLRDLLENEEIPVTDLKRILKNEAPLLVKKIETSRYVLDEIPNRFNVVFSPVLDWRTVKEEIIWDTVSAMLTKEPFVLKLATLAPEGTPWLDVPQKILVPRIINLTNGKLRPKFYTGGVMGEDTDVLRKMDIGQLDGCGCTTLGVVKASPDATVLMTPGLFNSYEEIDHICRVFRKRLDRSFEKRGYICGAIIDTGFLYVFSKNRISDLDDLKKQKTMTSMGSVESALLDALEVDAIPVVVPEVVSALSTGLADTFIAPPAWTLGMQAYQYVNYYIQKPFFYAPGVVLLSANTRDKIRRHFDLPETLVFNTQELIVHEIKSIEPEWKKRGRVYEEKSLKAFEAKCGIKPVVLSPEALKTLEQASERVQREIAGKAFSADLLNDVVVTLEQFRNQ